MVSSTVVLKEDPDVALMKAMHGKSAEEKNAFFAMLKKNNSAHREITNEYVRRWKDEKGVDATTEEARKERTTEYMGVVNNYYDLVTDFYEEAWAQSFHFCRFSLGEPFLQALARHEHYLAYKLGIKGGAEVLDVGCGVGGPAREIARFTGCQVVGVNNNAYQIARATKYAEKAGLSDQVSFFKGDFMHLDFPPNTFDFVYAIEATVHAPSLQKVYEQIFRVLKPGGRFGVYEWVMTDRFDETNPEHRAIRLGIERGNGIVNMKTQAESIEAIQAAGFVIEHEEDLAERPDPIPWYYPIAGELRHTRSLWDMLTVLRMTKFGRAAMGQLLWTLETLRLAPAGTSETAQELADGADHLVRGGQLGLFTPMYLMIGKKPEL
ncbi:putative tocopherol O-methyltransferase [Aspergillus steynii IBT 23096]|uniref:Putative tocopherol O-methyltransferase n=1 Tax=Aspergillus steynii IBT 23096 TaxID=1392250 RepID=A0A2I2GJI4_9EURO|nr:putative tocopherol O-methyltransferase [Aspergillus steynii IBT 23096]PLB53038.1 putative tocopherol O-methyltransferase [Aspergillus steynii IBT 23096]